MSQVDRPLITRRQSWLGTVLAVAIVAGWVWIAMSAQLGVGPAQLPLDPIWREVRERGTLRVAVDIGFRPFAEQRGEQLVGFDIELARAIATQLGVEVEFVPTGFDALYDALTSRRADLIASALPYAPEQGYRARFSSFYFDAGQMLVVRSEAPIGSTDDLPGRRLGVVLGSDADTLGRRLAESVALNLESSYEDPQTLLAELSAGRLDAVIVDRVSTLTAINRGLDVRIAQALSFEPYVLAVAPQAFQLHEAVNQALGELEQQGLLEELAQRWMR